MFSSLSGMVPYCLLICSRIRLPRRWYQSCACWYTLSWRRCKSSNSLPSTWERERTQRQKEYEVQQSATVQCWCTLWSLRSRPWGPPDTLYQRCGSHLFDFSLRPWICCHQQCPRRTVHQAAGPGWESPAYSHSLQTCSTLKKLHHLSIKPAQCTGILIYIVVKGGLYCLDVLILFWI